MTLKTIYATIMSGLSSITAGFRTPNGAVRKPITCWDGATIYLEIYDAKRKRWLPTGQKCPPKPVPPPVDDYANVGDKIPIKVS